MSYASTSQHKSGMNIAHSFNVYANRIQSADLSVYVYTSLLTFWMYSLSIGVLGKFCP